MSEVPILVCGCGKRLRAPGAKPGRVGRCPACGETLRVPEPEPEPTPARTPKPKKTKKVATSTHETAIWDGLIPPPQAPETALIESLLYPFWGATGVASLVILPPLLWFASIPMVSSVLALATNPSAAGLGAFFLLLPSGFGFLLVLGYALLYLARVTTSSAEGEVHLPRWPDWDPSALLAGLGRWLWAGFMGLALGGLPATAYWISCGDVDLFDTLILSELAAVGAIYALMALLASILHDDLLAANPFTVVTAIWRLGWDYLLPCLLAGFAALVAVALGALAFSVETPALAAFLFWLFWVVSLYEAMVVLRVLGLVYHTHAADLGWFRSRTRGRT